jgi:hypothetical protein
MLFMQATELHKKLFENANSDWRANDIAQKVAEEKQREMDLLLNRYQALHPLFFGTEADPSCRLENPRVFLFGKIPIC